MQLVRVQLTEPISNGRTEAWRGNVVMEGILLGSTNKYLFIYDLESGVTSAMPEENIVRVMIKNDDEEAQKRGQSQVPEL